MAHRLGCELEGIAAVGSIAGSPPSDVTGCRGMPPVVLQIHGEADEVVRFGGGRVLDRDDVAPHPGPVAGLAGWAKRAGCPAVSKPAGTLDLEPAIDGPETERLRFGPCASTIELWRVPGVGHDVASSRGAFVLLMDSLLRTSP
jgi:poly(3-hydroxybutyrate) depolymerase